MKMLPIYACSQCPHSKTTDSCFHPDTPGRTDEYGNEPLEDGSGHSSRCSRALAIENLDGVGGPPEWCPLPGSHGRPVPMSVRNSKRKAVPEAIDMEMASIYKYAKEMVAIDPNDPKLSVYEAELFSASIDLMLVAIIKLHQAEGYPDQEILDHVKGLL